MEATRSRRRLRADDETPSKSEGEDAPLHEELPKPHTKLPPLLPPLSTVPTPMLDRLGERVGSLNGLLNVVMHRATAQL